MSTQQAVMPATDILEREDGFHIVMDIPGVAMEDIAISLEQNELAVRSVSHYAADREQPMRSEFSGFRYERLFTLSDMVDRERIRAVARNGVLELFLPRAESMKPRRIEIRAE